MKFPRVLYLPCNNIRTNFEEMNRADRRPLEQVLSDLVDHPTYVRLHR